jgi:hypothetical protein
MHPNREETSEFNTKALIGDLMVLSSAVLFAT